MSCMELYHPRAAYLAGPYGCGVENHMGAGLFVYPGPMQEIRERVRLGTLIPEREIVLLMDDDKYKELDKLVMDACKQVSLEKAGV